MGQERGPELAPVTAITWPIGEVRTDEDLSNYLIHRPCLQSKLVLTSHSDSLNIISCNTNDYFSVQKNFFFEACIMERIIIN